MRRKVITHAPSSDHFRKRNKSKPNKMTCFRSGLFLFCLFLVCLFLVNPTQAKTKPAADRVMMHRCSRQTAAKQNWGFWFFFRRLNDAPFGTVPSQATTNSLLSQFPINVDGLPSLFVHMVVQRTVGFFSPQLSSLWKGK